MYHPIPYLPAGGISKTDIRRFLYWAADHLGYTELRGVVAAPPSAELEPIREGEEAQTDEQDMGMTYDVSTSAIVSRSSSSSSSSTSSSSSLFSSSLAAWVPNTTCDASVICNARTGF